ncbi:MAG: GNAT family N-acetyltransferase [Telluria sp.]
MHIQIETPDQPDVAALFAQLQALHAKLYPAAAGTPLPLASMLQPEVRFLVARDDSGRVVGCVALVLRGEYAELRRMIVDEAARGQGIGRALLDQLALHALAAGVHLLKLTTGVHQREALALYERFGFSHCAPYGGGGTEPLEVCMEMRL